MNDDKNIKTEMTNSSKVYALFYSFFLIPLMLTIFGVLFFFLFKMLTYEKQDPYHLLNNIQSGALTKRWQSAYELSNLMRDFDNIPNDYLFNNQLITMYQKSIHDDPRVRTYLALAMGQTKNDVFCETLYEGLKDKNLENKIAAINSSGQIKCQQSIPLINDFIINGENIQEKLASVIAAGNIADESSVSLLILALDDEEANIRWDAAVSLAKIGDKSGYNILSDLLTRKYYDNYPEVNIKEIDNTILTVLALLSRLEVKSFKNELSILANDEKNIKIREFAMKILSEYY